MEVETQIREQLIQRFQPQHLELENESHMHSVPANSETHFRLVMASDLFRGKTAVARHQLVYGELAAQLAGPVHALALHLYDPDEWADKQSPPMESPDCLGGSKADADTRI